MVFFVGLVGAMGIYGTEQIIRAFNVIVNGTAPALHALLEIKSTANEMEAETMSFELLGSGSTVSEGTSASDKKFNLLAKVEQMELWEARYRRFGSGNPKANANHFREIQERKDQVMVAALDLIRLKELKIADERSLLQKQKLEEAQRELKGAIDRAVQEELRQFELQQEKAERTVATTVRVNLIATGAALSSALLLGILLSGLIAGRISELRTAALAVAQGNLDQRVRTRGRDEIGDLAGSFNVMAERLQADLARREAAERALAQAHAELELRVEQRTSELRAAHARLQEELTERERTESEKARLEAQLRRAQKLEAIGTLTGGIAHDFNNILGAILGYTEMALDAVPKGSNLRRYVGNVMAAANRAKDLVDQILAFTQPGSRERVPVRMAPLLGEVVELIKASLPEAIELRLCVNAEDATVEGDAIRLHQLVMNLCTNAVQAMPDGGRLEIALDVIELGKRRVQRRHTLEPGAYVRLEVTDTGQGIDEATLDRVFDPFFTTKGLGRGTGLGLSLVHSIVGDHGGAIEVLSTPGQGSCFTVYLPRSLETASANGTDRMPIPKGRGETVLLVDDDEALVLLGEEMIAALGYKPVGFKDSQAALEAFQARPARFDLVVTDQLMPRMSGTELATRLRQIRPDIPVLLMSGFGGPELAHKAERAAVHALLKKPLQSRDLAQAIASAVGVNKKLGAESRQSQS